jgi:hypothetical protein
LERELEEARKQRDKWKANHDNQVAINRTLRDRPDLGGRAKLVDALAEQCDELQQWKDSAMQVESSWDAQSVGKLLGFALGSAIRPQIEPAIREIIKQRDALAEALRNLTDEIGRHESASMMHPRLTRAITAGTKLTTETK